MLYENNAAERIFVVQNLGVYRTLLYRTLVCTLSLPFVFMICYLMSSVQNNAAERMLCYLWFIYLMFVLTVFMELSNFSFRQWLCNHCLSFYHIQGPTNCLFNPISEGSASPTNPTLSAAAVLPSLQCILQQNNMQRVCI